MSETHSHDKNGSVTDPVCGMTVDPETTAHHYHHGGQDYHFCSAGCRGKFEAAPDDYLAGRQPPSAPGPFRSDAYREGCGDGIRWGLCQDISSADRPFLLRFDCNLPATDHTGTDQATTDQAISDQVTGDPVQPEGER